MSDYDVGVNYWPAGSAMGWWTQFSRDDFARDVAAIADAGGSSIRIFLRWEDFQPAPDAVSRERLADLVTAADVVAERELRLIPTLFTGHMSGANWLPRWATEPGEHGRFPTVSGGTYVDARPRSWFDDEDVAAAQARLARAAASALRGHQALWAWDLGNENSNVAIPSSRDRGRAWLDRMTRAIRGADPGALITIGLHQEDLEQDRRIGPAEAAEVADFISMHGYPLYASWARSRVDPHVPELLAQVARWLGGKDVLFEEFGMPTPTHEEEDDADVYVAEALDLLYETGTIGAMLWCSADYTSELWDSPPFDVAPHERFFGLWRADGTAKPATRHLARFRGVPRRDAVSPSWGDLDPARYYDAPLANLVALYERAAVVAR